MIQDEMLSHRLGLVPIYADPRKFRERAAEEDADEHNVISFRLQIKCEAGRGVRHRHTGLQGYRTRDEHTPSLGNPRLAAGPRQVSHSQA
jgi:hypothetical protein